MLIHGQSILNTPLYHTLPTLSILCANIIHVFSAGHVILDYVMQTCLQQ